MGLDVEFVVGYVGLPSEYPLPGKGLGCGRGGCASKVKWRVGAALIKWAVVAHPKHRRLSEEVVQRRG